MRSIRFVIPIKLDDLIQSTGHPDIYSVQYKYDLRDIGHKLNELSEYFKSNGIHFLLEDNLHNFDVFYYCLKHFTSLDTKHKELLWKLMSKCLNTLYNDFETFLNRFDPNERENYCNLLKMIVYVFCTLTELFEEQDIKQSTNIDYENIGKKTNKKNKRTEESYGWQQNKDKGLSVLLRLLSLPLHRVFNPPVVEDEFINVVTKCCYKILENPVVMRQKDSNITNSVFHIIGSAIEKYRQSLSFCLKLIQLLQLKEQLVPILANLVDVIVKKHNQKLIISEIIREIKRLDIKDLSRDSSGPRSISSFLIEVSEKCSQEMLSSISDLLEFLEEESYLMRNATLSIIGNLVIKELSKDGTKERNLRDRLLDKLEDHIHDNTSYTRSRALQVWCTLCQAEVIPLPRLETLIEAVVGRLRDKSCFVRKYAVQFLNQFLTKNPFAAKLPLEMLKTYHQKEEEKLKEMIKHNEEQQHMDIEIDKNSQHIWSDIEIDFLEFWTRLESSSDITPDDENDNNCNNIELFDNEDLDGLLKVFRDLVVTKKFKSALSLLNKMKEQFADNQIFDVVDSDSENMEVSDEETDDEVEESDEDMDKQNRETKKKKSKNCSKLPEMIALSKKVFIENSTDDKLILDLGSKAVEKDIEKIATVLIQSSQEPTDQQSRPRTTTIEVARPSIGGNDAINNVNRQQVLVKYLNDCIKFTEQIQIAIPLVSDLLMSKNITDVQEAIEFFVSAYKFGVKEAITGVRKLILLIWSQEKTIKDAAVLAYKSIYLDFDSDVRLAEASEKAKAFSVVKSLSELVMGATLGELISIEQLLKELMDTNDIQQIHIQVLWERFSMKLSNTTPEDSKVAIQLIGMLATSNPELVRSDKNLNAIILEGLGERGRNDSRLVSETCIALGKAYRIPKTETSEHFFRLPKSHDLFTNLRQILVNGLDNLNDNYYNMMADNVIKVLFQLAENPDYLSEQLIKEMLQKLISLIQNEEIANENKENTDSIETDRQSILSSQQTVNCEQLVSQTIQYIRHINTEILSRFISIIGTIALNVLIHIDLNVLTELKIRNHIKEEKDKKTNKTPRRKSRTPGKTPGTVGPDNNLEEEIGLAGANAMEDQEQEYLNKICNEEIVIGNNLLGRLTELVVTIAQEPLTFPDVKLRTAACLTLAKFMTLSESFCRLQLRLLFTIMEKSDAIIRANTIIAAGDLCVRYPNLLDQWSKFMFERLRDNDVTVKLNTLKVLSRLILSDMLKVKGQISEMARLMVDENEILSSHSRLFFTELGKKQNAIYNVLPDIISHLSDTENGLRDEEEFQTVMKFIFDLIEKDRQTICLVEKLCQRFRSTTDERQWRDLAYCLSLLNYTERSFQKLHENLICFADKLFCDFVYDCIQTVVNSTRKIPNIKNETKQLIDEFLNKVEECRTKGTNEDDSEFQKVVGTPPSAVKRLSLHKTRPHISSNKKQIKQNKNKRKTVSKGSEEEDTEEEIIINKNQRTVSDLKIDRPKRAVRKMPVIHDSDEESS
ncbi:condensin complex subunit 1-like [Oppia nitens]|uniref:condensin complex subunit 1-like n=1 Tax=Oppia nitens TaxID=1686743 RepID=UPI0023DB5830|nr:condensin complex subunit 1-like [Oppia nitens]